MRRSAYLRWLGTSHPIPSNSNKKIHAYPPPFLPSAASYRPGYSRGDAGVLTIWSSCIVSNCMTMIPLENTPLRSRGGADVRWTEFPLWAPSYIARISIFRGRGAAVQLEDAAGPLGGCSVARHCGGGVRAASWRIEARPHRPPRSQDFQAGRRGRRGGQRSSRPGDPLAAG
jgi:hypothetical protein